MFGLPSLQKLLVLAALIAIVWYGFKLIGRLQQARRTEEQLRRSGKGSGKGHAGGDGSARSPAAEDLVACSNCGAFVSPQGAKSCGRTGCPY